MTAKRTTTIRPSPPTSNPSAGRTRRRNLLAGQDGHCRRRCPLHHPPHAHPGQRGHRQCGPRRPRRRQRRRPGRGAGRLSRGGLILAQATLYLANAPKSNTALKALAAAKDAIERGANTEVPLHLRNASFGGAERLGYGRDYRYPHDFPRHWVQQQYLPDGVAGGYFHPPGEGREVSRPRAPEPED